jgi:alkanesulfonate monooxygenase SsuD/methylene tetrahydromethanopterin reductase-like flavin-dependent oxidoreductase (luciferase family)
MVKRAEAMGYDMIAIPEHFVIPMNMSSFPVRTTFSTDCPRIGVGKLICDHVKRGKANRKVPAARADATNAPYLAAASAGLAPPPGSPITRKVGVGPW